MRLIDILIVILSLVMFAGWLEAVHADEPSAALPPRADLTYYLDADGVRRPIVTAADWRLRRDQILRGMEEATGPLPSTAGLPRPTATLIAERETDGLIERLIHLDVEPGDRLPALLYLPRVRQKPVPAVIALHPTGAPGKRLVAGEEPKQNRGYGVELAQRGYIVLCPDYPSFGDYASYNFDTDRYQSGTMKGIFNHLRCVDYLRSLPEVNAERIGAIGHSLGGHNAIFLGVFDERVAVVVSSCGWTPFHDYYDGQIAGWTSPRYMPRLKTIYHLDPDQVPFDFYELVAAIAPRGFFSSSPLDDSNFAVEGVRKAEPVVRQVFDLHQAGSQLKIIYPDCEHDFPPAVREQAYQFMDRILRPEVAGQ